MCCKNLDSNYSTDTRTVNALALFSLYFHFIFTYFVFFSEKIQNKYKISEHKVKIKPK